MVLLTTKSKNEKNDHVVAAIRGSHKSFIFLFYNFVVGFNEGRSFLFMETSAGFYERRGGQERTQKQPQKTVQSSLIAVPV